VTNQGIKEAVHGPAVQKPVRRLDFTLNDAVVILQTASVDRQVFKTRSRLDKTATSPNLP
jgi:hypothetical protein